MELRNILCIFFLTCTLFVIGSTAEGQAEFTENQIKKEIELFNTVKDKFLKENVNVFAEFSYSIIGDDDEIIRSESFELRPKDGPKKEVNSEKHVDQDTIKIIFDLAKKHNVSAAASLEKFDKDGVLSSKTVYANKVKIQYDDGNTEIKIGDDGLGEDDDDDEDLEELVNLLKEFEIPVEAEREDYDKSGKIIKTEKSSYEPKKVKILKSNGMSVEMQMKASEALKRSCVMKQKGTDRIKLLVRYLGIQFPEYDFYASIGEGTHSVGSEVDLKILFDGEIYFIWGTEKSNDDE